ncbi:MAG: cobyric acid synthase [Chloroflexi bacterium]|nr:cobyric acid synthase [Chloroflexota bacterium]
MRLARCVMVQGTASDVGKSVIATALCRVLRDEGRDVAPFKAQNMSLNAAVTPDGHEIARAQAAQAEAAGIPAHVDMSPILLKPVGDSRSQLIVRGCARATVDARRYWTTRGSLWPVVASSLRSLRARHDVVVIEGAGSPAEMNLRRGDLANMRVARHARAPVILVGDIERGGIFAQFVGTLALLGADRERVRALMVNKFRGDRALFDDGVRWLTRETGLPIAGVLPYSDALAVPAEDSLALSSIGRSLRRGAPVVAVVRYPRISNFDDLDALSAAGADVRFVRTAADLDGAALVVLPGSKSTIDDLDWLRASGIAARLPLLVRRGVPVLGLCGGFQMLGTRLADPRGVEGPARTVEGLGLLPVRTTFEKAKRTAVARGTVATASALLPAGTGFSGYEIHTGTTRRSGCRPFATLRRGDGTRVQDGAVSADGGVVGTYAHGLMETAGVAQTVLRAIAPNFTPDSASVDRYAALAQWFRAAVDVPRLWREVGLE